MGLRRYDALVVLGTRVRLIRMEVGETVLAEAEAPLLASNPCDLKLEPRGHRRRAWVNGELLFDLTTTFSRGGGAAGFVVERGTLVSNELRVENLRTRDRQADLDLR